MSTYPEDWTTRGAALGYTNHDDRRCPRRLVGR